MEVGDKVKFPFAGKEKEGVVVKVFPKKVHIKADFDRHPGKVIVRSVSDLEGKAAPQERKKSKPKKKDKREEKE